VTTQCTSCSALTGQCKTCASPFILTSDFECGCPAGKFDDGTTCADLTACPTGQYNDGANNCLSCGASCDACEDKTGKCVTCATDTILDFSDPSVCVNKDNCPNPVGPVDAPVGCFSVPFNTKRVIPPFSDTDKNIDWRNWGIVTPI
jgi:hypothetical protein